jgi:hypothetical protein
LRRDCDTELGEAREVLLREALRVLDALPQSRGLPHAAGPFEGVECFAIRPVADRVHADGPARGCARPHDLGEVFAARDSHAAAVEHPGRVRSERAVHEDLQIADAQERRAEPAPQRERAQLRQHVRGNRLPDPQRERALRLEALPESCGAEPAVLVVDARDAAGVRELDALTHRGDVLVGGDRQIAVLEAPGSLFAQHAGRLALRIPLDDPSVHLEVIACECKRGRVEPERVIVLRDQRCRAVTRDRVEVVLRRFAGFAPVAASPPVAAQPGPRHPRFLDACQRFVE